MSLSEETDERLMLSYRDGNAEAFEVLYGRHRAALYRYLAHQCGSGAIADELYQDVWYRVITARAGYEPLARFSTFLYRIAHNLLMDYFRKSARETAKLYEHPDEHEELPIEDLLANQPAPDHETPHALLDRQAVVHRIHLALDALPVPQREAFLLSEEGGLSVEEIAVTMSASREASKSRLRYAVSKLRHSLCDLL